MPNLTISISDELNTRMAPYRNRIDISRVCEKALAKEIKHLERKSRDESPRGPMDFGGPGIGS